MLSFSLIASLLGLAAPLNALGDYNLTVSRYHRRLGQRPPMVTWIYADLDSYLSASLVLQGYAKAAWLTATPSITLTQITSPQSLLHSHSSVRILQRALYSSNVPFSTKGTILLLIWTRLPLSTAKMRLHRVKEAVYVDRVPSLTSRLPSLNAFPS